MKTDPMLHKIRQCFHENQVLYTQHARSEMQNEPLGPILEEEVFEATETGEIIEGYPEDIPYPSVLVFGRTNRQCPIHLVCAHATEDNLAIVITVYEPDSSRWIDYRRRINP